jgi:molybdenum cofactor cytidylyltransferase
MRLSAVVLAAGSGRRFGSDKLKAELAGKTVFQHTYGQMVAVDFQDIVVVVRPGWYVTAPDIRFVENPYADEGMGRSLALGISSLKPTDAAFVVLADMPFLPEGIFQRLAQDLPGHDIVVPVHDGQNGHPVLFSSVCFPDLQALHGDRGGRALIDSGRYRVNFVDIESNGVVRDVDRPDDLHR